MSLESGKIRKLSPSDGTSVSEFSESKPPCVGEEKVACMASSEPIVGPAQPIMEPAQPIIGQVPKQESFVFHDNFWDELLDDPMVRARMEAEIHKEIDTRWQQLLTAELDKIEQTRKAVVEDAYRQANQQGMKNGFDKGHEEGLKKALLTGRALIDEASAVLKNMCNDIARERTTVLRGHEKKWCEALNHVAKRFLVWRPEDFVERLRLWLSQSVGDVVSRHRIRVFVSESTLKSLKAVEVSVNQGEYDIAVDSNLVGGQIRCEWDGAGVFFSPEDEFGKLSAFVSESLGSAHK